MFRFVPNFHDWRKSDDLTLWPEGAATDRIHLIFEYYDLDQPEPAWLGALQARAAS